MRVGSLFSGIGGFDLGLERAGMQVKWQVENNEFCNRVLAKHWPGVQRYGDIKAVDWQEVEAVDLVCGGFPCQPFSLAGKRRSQDDDRYLWPEVVRCLDTLRPTWFLGENVPGLINLALDQVCTDLESLGYTVWPVCVPACAVDAAHQRQRIWILGHANSNSQPTMPVNEEMAKLQCDVADAISEQSERGRDRVERWQRSASETSCDDWTRGRVKDVRWPVEPNVGRVAHGVPARVDRLRGLGNAIVPQIAEEFGELIMVVEQSKDLL